MPDFVRLTNRRKDDLRPGEQVVAACTFASPKAVFRWAIGTTAPDTGANLGATAGPAGALVGGLLSAAAIGIGRASTKPASDEDRSTTGRIELPDFVMAGVTDRALLLWRYEPGAASWALVKELRYRVPLEAIRSAKVRPGKDGSVLDIEFVDGATFTGPIPPAYGRRARQLAALLDRRTTPAPTTWVRLDWDRFQAPPTPPKPPPSRRTRVLSAAILALLLALLIIGCVFALRDPGGPAPASTDHRVRRTVTVTEHPAPVRSPT